MRRRSRRTVADPAMGGWGGRPPPPIDQKLELVMAARLRHGGKFSLKSLIFGHFIAQKCTKSFQLQGGFSPLTSHQGLCPWTPLGAPPPDPRLGSRSARERSPWSAPLAIPGSATARGQGHVLEDSITQVKSSLISK